MDADLARRLWDYDPETGVFIWRITPNSKASRGSRAGKVRSDGYRTIGYKRAEYLAHRLAWLHVYGEWPARWVDHRNGDHDDNRIINLRSVAPSENAQNVRGPHKDSASGYLGVTRRGHRWAARIRASGVEHNLGRFATAEEAAAAYRVAKFDLHPYWEGAS
jgi:hypothetical protein